MRLAVARGAGSRSHELQPPWCRRASGLQHGRQLSILQVVLQRLPVSTGSLASNLVCCPCVSCGESQGNASNAMGVILTDVNRSAHDFTGKDLVIAASSEGVKLRCEAQHGHHPLAMHSCCFSSRAGSPSQRQFKSKLHQLRHIAAHWYWSFQGGNALHISTLVWQA